MIQVIQRIADIMNHLASGDDWTLGRLAQTTGVNNGTLCNLLKSLIAVGWIVKSERGSYRLSEAFRELGNPPQWNPELVNFLQEALADCSGKIRETVLAFTLHQDKIVTMAKATYQHTLMINDERFYARMSLYTSVSGEVLCAGLSPDQRQLVFACHPLTETDLQGETDVAGYEKKLDGIQAAGQNIAVNQRLGIKSWAVPIHDAQGEICACLGLSVPLVRLADDGGEAIIRELHETAVKISVWLARNGLRARQILKLPFPLNR